MSETWRDRIKYKIHPAAHEYFPMMSDAELDELGQDILAHGLNQPVVMWVPGKTIGEVAESRGLGDMYVLDGRNRLAALARVIADPEELAEHYEAVFDGADFGAREELRQAYGRGAYWLDGNTDPVAFVISANIHRRHLTADKKREIIAALIKAQPERSDRQIAETAKVSPTTVGTVRATLEKAGDVSRLDTRTDTKGRQQPATKPASKPPAAPPPVTAPPAPEKPVAAGVTPSAPDNIDLTTSDDKLAEQLVELIGEERLLNLAPRFFERPLDPRSGEPGTSPIGKLVEALGKFVDAGDIPIAERRALAQSCLSALDLSLEDLKPRLTRFEQWAEFVEGLRDLQAGFRQSLDDDFLNPEQKKQYRPYVDAKLLNLAVEHK